MSRRLFWLVAGVLILKAGFAFGQSGVPIEQRRWFETRSTHFNLYSCAAPQDVFALVTHLEQFSDAYTLLSGAPVVVSPPIEVVAFPDRESMKPFLPLYHGQPANLAGLFKRGNDVNLIVLALPGTNSAFTQMDVIFHEYAHLLFRQNSRVWPLWLSEGVADIYSTFQSSGYTVRIARPIDPYVQLLKQQSDWPPLKQLFAVAHDSPEYNEGNRQGVFYAQSWLLTHYLMSGGSVAYRTRFEQFTRLLRDGQPAEQAFTNALQTSLPAMEAQMRRYLETGRFEPIQWMLPVNLSAPKPMNTRLLTPVEVYYRLGRELMGIDRLDAAEEYFQKAQKLAPGNPLSYEGLGIVAAARGKNADSVRLLKEGAQKGSLTPLGGYMLARGKYELTSDGKGRYHTLPDDQAQEIREGLLQSLRQMPNFGPAFQLLGFLETVQGTNLATAEKQLQRAVQLEPDNPTFLLSLAQTQIRNNETNEARQTLKPLLLPQTEAKLRSHAEELLKKMGRDDSSK